MYYDVAVVNIIRKEVFTLKKKIIIAISALTAIGAAIGTIAFAKSKAHK